MKRYVVGLMFNENGDKLVLIRKNRPAWQAGRLNGVGGHIEPGETARAAMVREFCEETGVLTTADAWTDIAELVGEGFRIEFFSAVSNAAVEFAQTTTDEAVEIWDPLAVIGNPELLPNLRWLISFAWDSCSAGPVKFYDAPSKHDVFYGAEREHV